MHSGGRLVELHQLPSAPPSPEDSSFGLRLSIDGSPRSVERIVLWMLEPGPAAGSPLLHVAHLLGPRGERAFELLFNSEMLVPGDEARAVGAVLSGGAVAGRLDLGSLMRADAVLGGRYVQSAAGFDRNGNDTGRRGDGVFTLCTCTAFPVGEEEEGGAWEFHLLEFDVHYRKENGRRRGDVIDPLPLEVQGWR